MSGRARRTDAPIGVQVVGGLSRVDYCDAFRAPLDMAGTPQELVVAGLATVNPLVLDFARHAQRAMLGLRVEPHADSRPLGWTVVAADTAFLVLAADGPRAHGRVVASRRSGEIVVSTMLQLDGLRARLAWRLLAPVHRATARYLLSRTVRSAP